MKMTYDENYILKVFINTWAGFASVPTLFHLG